MDHDQLKIVIEAAVGLSPVRNKVRGPADGVFSSFGTVLNFNAIISRLDFRKTQHSSVDPVVIIRMENHHEKITLLRCIGAYRRAAKQQLCLHMMGFDSQAALYVNEQLLREHYVIFKEAMKLKKRRLLSAVFARRGLVHVRCSDNIYCIESMD